MDDETKPRTKKEPRDAMRPLKSDTAAALEAAGRLGDAGEARYERERDYLMRAVRALLGEYGDEAKLASPDKLVLPGSEITVRFSKWKSTEGCRIGHIALEYGKARQGKERDGKYTAEGGAWNVQRIATRAFVLHERWLTQQREKAERDATIEAARQEARRAMAAAHAVHPSAHNEGWTGLGGVEMAPTAAASVKHLAINVGAGEYTFAVEVKFHVKPGQLEHALKLLREI